MAEYIERKMAIQAASIWNGDESTEAWIQSALQKLPAADVVERKHGKWITKYPLSTCSVCEQTMILHDFANFCPNCGARMDGEDDV